MTERAQSPDDSHRGGGLDGTALDALTEHTAFVRRLAVGLVGNRDDADDLAQDVMLAAVQRPPRAPGAWRAWLRRTAQNVLANEYRSRSRRARRERLAEGAEPTCAVDEVIEREELRARVIARVLQLEEPLRSVVLMRYFEGLTSREIAARLGRPAGTVRSQLKTGLDRLRAGMDADHEGDRRAWAVPFLASVGMKAPAAATLGGGGETLAKISWLRAAPGRLASAALVVGAVGLMGAFAVLAATLVDPPSVAAPDSRPASHAVAAPFAASRVAGAVARSPWSAMPPAPDARPNVARPLWVDPVVRPVQQLRGRVVDGRSQRPVPASVRIESVSSVRGRRAFEIEDDRRIDVAVRAGSDGRFAFDGPAGLYRLTATTADGRRALAHGVTVGGGAARGGAQALELWVAPVHPLDRAVVVEVLDGTRRPVPGAEVALLGGDRVFGPIGHSGIAPLTGTADEQGRVLLLRDRRLEALFEGVVVARSGDGRVGLQSIWRPEHGNSRPWIQVELGAPGSVVGEVVGDAVGAGRSLRVRLLPRLTYGDVYRNPTLDDVRWEAPVDGGRFSIDGVPAGRWVLRLEGCADRCLALRPGFGGRFEPFYVGVEAGGTTRVELELALAAVHRGRVVDAEGAPVAGAFVRARGRHPADGVQGYTAHAASGPDEPTGDEWSLTGPDGRFELAGLMPGHHLVTVEAVGFARWVSRLDAAPGEECEHEVQLRPGARIEGVVAGREAVGVTRVGGVGAPIVIYPGLAGAFSTAPLAAGTYRVGSWSENRIGPSVEVEVRPERSSWVDLRDVGRRQVSGVVVGPAGLLGRTVVRASTGSSASVSSTGAFAIEVPQCGARLKLDIEIGGIVVARVSRRWDESMSGLTIQLEGLPCVVRTVGPQGNPVPAGLVIHGPVDGAGPTYVVSDGEVLLDLVPRGALSIAARFGEGKSVRRVRVAADDARWDGRGPIELEVRADPVGMLELEVVDHRGAPAVGRCFLVHVWRGDGAPPDPGQPASGWQLHGYEVCGLEGRLRMRGVPAGPVLVHRGGRMQEPYRIGGRGEAAPPWAAVVDVPADGVVRREVVLPARDRSH